MGPTKRNDITFHNHIMRGAGPLNGPGKCYYCGEPKKDAFEKFCSYWCYCEASKGSTDIVNQIDRRVSRERKNKSLKNAASNIQKPEKGSFYVWSRENHHSL